MQKTRAFLETWSNMIRCDTNAFDRLFGIGWDVDSERVINNDQTVKEASSIPQSPARGRVQYVVVM